MHFDKHIKDNNAKLVSELTNALAHKKVTITSNLGQVTINIEPLDLLDIMHELKENKELQFLQLVDVTAVDYPTRDERFDVIYMLLSHRKNQRVLLKTRLKENQAIDTATELYPSADWHEREVYDMFGIVFDNHPNLKRILTDYEFEGHPLRKDFPVYGEKDMFYDEELQDCVYKAVELPEDTRFYDTQTKWNQLNDNFDLAEFDKPNRGDE